MSDIVIRKDSTYEERMAADEQLGFVEDLWDEFWSEYNV